MTYSSAIIERNTDNITLDELITLTGEAANQEWYKAAIDALKFVCESRKEFTVDHVRELLDNFPVKTKNTSALGAVMKEGKQNGWCISTGLPVRSDRLETHGRFITKWESMIYTS